MVLPTILKRYEYIYISESAAIQAAKIAALYDGIIKDLSLIPGSCDKIQELKQIKNVEIAAIYKLSELESKLKHCK